MTDFAHLEREAMARARWYVVHTQPYAENRAITHLVAQGYQVFCPRFRKVVRHARRRTGKFVPLFPGYLFIRLDVSRDRWRNVNGTRGVVRLLTQGDTPQAVPPQVVEDLQLLADARGALDQTSRLNAGQHVRIVEGPFIDFYGTLQRLDSTGRVRVLLNLLGRTVLTTLWCDALAPAA